MKEEKDWSSIVVGDGPPQEDDVDAAAMMKLALDEREPVKTSNPTNPTIQRPLRRPCHPRTCSSCSTVTTTTVDSCEDDEDLMDEVSPQTSVTTMDSDTDYDDEAKSYPLLPNTQQTGDNNIISSSPSTTTSSSNTSTSILAEKPKPTYPHLTDPLRTFLHRTPHTHFLPLPPTSWNPTLDCTCCNHRPSILRHPAATEPEDSYLHLCTTCPLRLCSDCAATITSDVCRGSLSRLISHRAKWKFGYSEEYLTQVQEDEEVELARWVERRRCCESTMGRWRPSRMSRLRWCVLAEQCKDWFWWEGVVDGERVLEDDDDNDDDDDDDDTESGDLDDEAVGNCTSASEGDDEDSNPEEYQNYHNGVGVGGRHHILSTVSDSDSDCDEPLTMKTLRPWRSEGEMDKARELRRREYTDAITKIQDSARVTFEAAVRNHSSSSSSSSSSLACSFTSPSSASSPAPLSSSASRDSESDTPASDVMKQSQPPSLLPRMRTKEINTIQHLENRKIAEGDIMDAVVMPMSTTITAIREGTGGVRRFWPLLRGRTVGLGLGIVRRKGGREVKLEKELEREGAGNGE